MLVVLAVMGVALAVIAGSAVRSAKGVERRRAIGTVLGEFREARAQALRTSSVVWVSVRRDGQELVIERASASGVNAGTSWDSPRAAVQDAEQTSALASVNAPGRDGGGRMPKLVQTRVAATGLVVIDTAANTTRVRATVRPGSWAGGGAGGVAGIGDGSLGGARVSFDTRGRPRDSRMAFALEETQALPDGPVWSVEFDPVSGVPVLVHTTRARAEDAWRVGGFASVEPGP